MKNCIKKLQDLIENTVLPDIEDYIDDIFEQIANAKNATDEDNEELNSMYEFRDEAKAILEDIHNNEIDKSECQDLYEEIKLLITNTND